MDILDEELLSFWRKLNEHGVRYIMIGGFAIRFHGQELKNCSPKASSEEY